MQNLVWETEVGTNRFESLCRRILDPEGDGENIRGTCLEASELYRGIFLPESAEDSWVGPMTAYYHILYQKLVVYMAEKLIQDEEYSQAEEICQRAINTDRFVEDFHYYWICAAYGQGEQETVLKWYKDTTGMLYRERLMTPSEHFKELYKVISSGEQEVVTDLDAIQGSLDTGGAGKGHGAYQCEYVAFKCLVQLERRGMEHSGNSVHLCLLAMGDRKGRTLKPEIQVRVMEHLRASIRKNLRPSNIYARCSTNQFILFLPSTTFENNGMVMNRILSAFNKSHVCKDIAVNCSLDVLKP